MSEAEGGGRKDDVVLLHGPSEAGDGIRVVRKREDSIELGELRPMREGQPIHGEVVRLRQREEHALLFDCEVLVPAPARTDASPASEPAQQEAASTAKAPALVPEERAPKALPHKGPPRVTSDAYRGGWELIFGGKGRDPGGAPN